MEAPTRGDGICPETVGEDHVHVIFPIFELEEYIACEETDECRCVIALEAEAIIRPSTRLSKSSQSVSKLRQSVQTIQANG